MNTVELKLTPELSDFVAHQVAGGTYKGADEFIVDVLTRLKDQSTTTEASLVAGLESGDVIEMDSAFWDSVRGDVKRRMHEHKS